MDDIPQLKVPTNENKVKFRENINVSQVRSGQADAEYSLAYVSSTQRASPSLRKGS